MRHAWVSRVGMVMLVGRLCLVGSGLGITPAAAAPAVKEDAPAGLPRPCSWRVSPQPLAPFQQALHDQDEPDHVHNTSHSM